VNSSELAADVIAWLRRVTMVESPPPNIVAYNIGLFETEDGYSGYLAGAERFDATSGDWACDEAFTPKERYLPLPVRPDEMKWQEVLERVAEVVREYLSSSDGASSFLGTCRAVTVGFDDGDLVRVR
jgi:hypothetical protein